ncbi:probable E3 SUMO-protein ligase RNF212 [Anguilla rostrata]|uniref:probable E3 SUMO-protein ligase RNF212 n=1 Tax=Anguilla rostrata TaxID=7938 RepID=UPI0030D14644
MQQEMQIINNVKAGQQSVRIAPSLGASMPTSLKQIQFASHLEIPQTPSASYLVDQMDMDSQVLYRKPEISGSMPRLSLISPPMDGRMGTVQHRSNSQTSLVTHSAKSATVSRDKPYKRSGYSQSTLTTPSSTLSYRREVAWETPSFNPPPPFRHSSLSSLSRALPLLSLQGRMPK